jgi:predicted PurR-regulated permease PerM
MLGAQTALSAVIRIVSTVVILGAVYFFIVKPALDTTEKITHNIGHTVNHSLNQGLNSANQAMHRAQIHSNRVQRQVRKRVRKTIKDANAQVSTTGIPSDAAKILKCIQKANGNVDKMQACQPGG